MCGGQVLRRLNCREDDCRRIRDTKPVLTRCCRQRNLMVAFAATFGTGNESGLMWLRSHCLQDTPNVTVRCTAYPITCVRRQVTKRCHHC